MAPYVLARTLHDAGLAAWFGGSLMGAVGLNGGAAQVDDPTQRARASTAGWSRWAPVSAVAVGAHLFGAGRLLAADRRRIQLQHGAATGTAAKAALTAAAVGVTAYSGVLNRKMAKAGDVPVQGATEAGAGTPPDVARTQRQLRIVQWVIPALTGGVLAVSSQEAERLRASSVARGVLRRLARPGISSLAVLGAGAAAVALLGKRASSGRRSPQQGSTQTTTSTPTGAVTLPGTPVTAGNTR